MQLLSFIRCYIFVSMRGLRFEVLENKSGKDNTRTQDCLNDQ
jgi:hypothetical protein